VRIGRAFPTLLAALLASGCGDSSTGPEDRPLKIEILETRTEPPANVTVTFYVSRTNGYPVPGLPVDAFELLDDGMSDSQFEASKAFQPKPGRFQASVALLLDMSGSITGSEALPALKEASSAFVDKALEAQGVVVGVWWFDGGADIVQLVDFTNDAETLKAAIEGLTEEITRDASTNLNGAIRDGVALVEERMADGAGSGIAQSGALVVFTDGTDQARRVSSSDALSAVEGTNISVYSIGLRGEIDEGFLNSVGSSGSAFADDRDALLEEFSGVGGLIGQMANSYYVLAYCSPRRDGVEHELTIRVTHGGQRAEATTSYPAVNFTGGCKL